MCFANRLKKYLEKIITNTYENILVFFLVVAIDKIRRSFVELRLQFVLMIIQIFNCLLMMRCMIYREIAQFSQCDFSK
jgi:hypothetical protein